jgi:hypothetical protein
VFVEGVAYRIINQRHVVRAERCNKPSWSETMY